MFKLIKRGLRKDVTQRAIAWVTALYLKLVFYTSKWTYRNEHFIKHYTDACKPCIIVFWHNRLMMCPFAWRFKKPFFMLISDHADGRLISKTVDHFDIQTIGGSKSKGGISAVRNMLRKLKQGHYIGITPDGPRGPAFVASPGVIELARIAQCEIIPVCYGIKRRKVLKTWDRFIIPLPFSRGNFAWGEPIKIARESSQSSAELSVMLAAAMQTLTTQVDAFCDCAE